MRRRYRYARGDSPNVARKMRRKCVGETRAIPARSSVRHARVRSRSIASFTRSSRRVTDSPMAGILPHLEAVLTPAPRTRPRPNDASPSEGRCDLLRFELRSEERRVGKECRTRGSGGECEKRVKIAGVRLADLMSIRN